MRLSHVLGSQISANSRSRGDSYFRSGAVHSLTVENGIITATVRGTESYAVSIEPDRALLRASCTCPYFSGGFDICKHIWAVILAAEAQSIPLTPPGVNAADIVLEPLYPEDDDIPDDIDDILGDVHESWALVARRQPPPRTPAAPPPWRRLLDNISTAASANIAPRSRLLPGQLLYVVDAIASAKSETLVIELMTRDRKINGEWGKPKPARLTGSDIRAHADVSERHLLERLVGPTAYFDYGGYDRFGQELARLQLRGVLVSDLVPLLCATGRCVLRMSGPPGPSSTSALSAPIEWDDGAPWSFTAAIRPADADAGYNIEGWFARGDERMEVADPLLVLAGGILFTHTHAARLSAGEAFTWLTALRHGNRITVPLESRDELIDAVLASSPRLAVVPDDLRIETVRGQPRPQLRLRPMKHRADRVRAELSFDYEGLVLPFDSPPRTVRSPGSTRAIQRDIERERRAMDALYQRGCRLDWSHETPERVLQIQSHLVPRVVRQLLDEGWHVEASGQVYRHPGAVTLSVSSGIDWFDLHGQVDYDGQSASLPVLLAALDRGETFVTLDDGTIGLLPEQWLRRHSTLARLGTAAGDHVRFRPSQVALLDALIAAQPEAAWDDTFGRARAQLQAFDGIQAVDPPPAFAGTLRGYQRDGLGWLTFLERFGFGGCLADDMGLGKTVMVLALLSARREGPPSLVVAPRSVVFNWRQEAARFTPDLRVLEYVGAGRAAMRAAFADHDVILTTYGTLRRDAEALSAESFDYVILDEAQTIKNASSVSAKTTRILHARHRLALSGTPIENHLGELWSLFEFLNPGLLSTAAVFNRAGSSQRLDDETIALLARGLRPFILRRTKEQVASDLPPKSEQTLYCELERPQRLLYDELRAHYRRTLLDGAGSNTTGRAKFQVLEALLRLRQAACHPGLIDRHRANEPSAKLDVLVPRLVEAVEEGHKTLVFSQFTSLLSILRARLDESGTPYEYLDGRTRDRQAKVERFQADPACRLFLISLKAGGLGLNLTAAEYVFLLDPWWNPAVESQAIDRAHRIGQSRHVFAYRLIARDTVEERVLELQQQKRRLADAILTANNSLIRDLRREDLELLLS
jgi:superfamily II DNA or RNA helicase